MVFIEIRLIGRPSLVLLDPPEGQLEAGEITVSGKLLSWPITPKNQPQQVPDSATMGACASLLL